MISFNANCALSQSQAHSEFQAHHTNQACYKLGIILPKYLCSEPAQGLDGIVTYVIIMVKIVGNGAKWVEPT